MKPYRHDTGLVRVSCAVDRVGTPSMYHRVRETGTRIFFDQNTMPVDFLKAHRALDKTVDACYGKKGFKSEPERLEFLFEKYKQLTSKD